MGRTVLIVEGYIGRDPATGEKQYACICVGCSSAVIRLQSQLTIRRLQRCAECSEKRVARILKRKTRERKKDTKHAYYQSAREQAEAKEEASKQDAGS